MRINKLHTICTMTLAAILFVGFEAAAQDWNMEAGAGCMDESCMFDGQTFNENSSVAKLEKVNLFAMNGVDPRVQHDRAEEAVRQFMPAGFAVNNKAINGTDGITGIKESNAVLVSPCYAFVEYHQVYGKQKDPNRSEEDYSMTINLGVGELENGFRWALKMTPVRVPGEQSIGRNGVVLMQLEKCAGKKLGWMNIAAPGAKNLVGKKISQIGYQGDLSKSKLTKQDGCTIRGYNSLTGLISHDCGSTAGACGSMLTTVIDGVPTMVGLDIGSANAQSGVLKDYSADVENTAVPFDMLNENPAILKIINDDIKSFGQPNPATQKQPPAKTQLASINS